jgi:hypothetical protein
MRLVSALVLAGVVSFTAHGIGQDSARDVLQRAVDAAGGVENLQRAKVLAWHGKATIYAGADQRIDIEGEWRVEPPDRALAETYLADKGPSTTRTLGIDNGRGFTRIGGKEQPMDPGMLSNERDQFYLYELFRLQPLLGPEYSLTSLAVTDGQQGLRVSRYGRRDVELYFDASNRLARAKTTVFDPMQKIEVPEELRLSGTVEAGGIKWPQRMQVFQSGRLFFEVEISNFRILPAYE